MMQEANEGERPILLVGLSNPATMGLLSRLSSLMARIGLFELLLTHVVTVARQISLTSGTASAETVRARDFLGEALRGIESLGVPARALVELARSVDEGLVAASESRGASLILVGYSEEEAQEDARGERRFDRTMHRVARNADCDLVVAKFRKDDLRKVLVPLGGDPRLGTTSLLCRALGAQEGATFRFLHLVPPEASVQEARDRMEGLLRQEGLLSFGDLEVMATDSVLDTIQVQAADQDVVILGHGASFSPVDGIFGGTDEKIAERVHSSVLLTRTRQGR